MVNLKNSKLKIIGHRGARGLAPENTLASLRKAIEHHVDEIEFDLHVTHDGVVVLSHNDTISDQAGNKLTIAKSTLNQLRNHKPDLTTFQEVVDNIGNQTPYYIEVKEHVDPQPIIAMLQTCLDNGWQMSDFAVASFDYNILKSFKIAMPLMQLIVNERWSGVRATHRARKLGTKRISMNQLWLWRGFIKGISSNYQLSAYTLNNPTKAVRWASYGLRCVITDYPDRFKSK